MLGELAVVVVSWLNRQLVPRRQRPRLKSKQCFDLLCLKSVVVLISKVEYLVLTTFWKLCLGIS
jgi:hypothetical protein